MTSIGQTPSTTAQSLERRSETQQNARVATDLNTQSSAPTAAVQPPASVAADAPVRTAADAATVDASRARAAGAEDAARNRMLAKNETPADGTAPRRGLRNADAARPTADEAACPIIREPYDASQQPVAELLLEVGKRGSGKGISDDGPGCLADPNRIIEV